MLQNILLFLPLGVGLGMLWRSWAPSLAVVIVTTVGVELMQATVLGGRFASVGDILANSIGGALGIWLGHNASTWAFPSPRRAWTLMRVAFVAAFALLAVATISLRTAPAAAPYMLMVGTVEPHGARFLGSLTRADVAGQSHGPGDTLDFRAVDDVLRRGARMVFQIESGPQTEFESTIFAIADRSEHALVRVTQDATDAALEMRVIGSLVGIRPPRVLIPRALPGEAGEPVRIDVEISPDRMRLGVHHGGEERWQSLRLGPATAWIPFYPFLYRSDFAVVVASLAWLAMLTFPAGYWAAFAAEGPQAAAPHARSRYLQCIVLLALFMMLGLAAVPAIAGVAIPPAAYWLAPVGGFVVGAAGGVIARLRA